MAGPADGPDHSAVFNRHRRPFTTPARRRGMLEPAFRRRRPEDVGDAHAQDFHPTPAPEPSHAADEPRPVPGHEGH